MTRITQAEWEAAKADVAKMPPLSDETIASLKVLARPFYEGLAKSLRYSDKLGGSGSR